MHAIIDSLCSGFITLTSFEPESPFPIFPDDQDRSGIENRRIRAAKNTDNQDDHEMLNRNSSKESQCDQCEQDSQLGINRASQSLVDGVINNRFVRHPPV